MRKQEPRPLSKRTWRIHLNVVLLVSVIPVISCHRPVRSGSLIDAYRKADCVAPTFAKGVEPPTRGWDTSITGSCEIKSIPRSPSRRFRSACIESNSDAVSGTHPFVIFEPSRLGSSAISAVWPSVHSARFPLVHLYRFASSAAINAAEVSFPSRGASSAGKNGVLESVAHQKQRAARLDRAAWILFEHTTAL